LGTEYPAGQYSQILDSAFQNKLTAKQIDTLNRISQLMKSLDADNISKLQEVYNNDPQIQFTNSIKAVDPFAENKNPIGEASIKKPIIEFADLPGGTFMMGSPVTELERKDDEILHQVTLNAFKMSKYCVTVEQYNLFCKATGRRSLWLWGFWGQDNMPVTQVTWFDATAFAEWMGCRLPTEAEREYATRANTTTPFYTGNCLTTDQANFNGDEPYSNCEEGRNRKRPITVGNFAPNNFGLYDMHGNVEEWCSDWYGAYNINEKMNPKGPETGKIKVFRGGSFSLPGWRCRSACRGGDPQGNRGAGLSFRIVKDK
jgi:formylglycine-generating enzyme required for sulfatase activity